MDTDKLLRKIAKKPETVNHTFLFPHEPKDYLWKEEEARKLLKVVRPAKAKAKDKADDDKEN